MKYSELKPAYFNSVLLLFFRSFKYNNIPLVLECQLFTDVIDFCQPRMLHGSYNHGSLIDTIVHVKGLPNLINYLPFHTKVLCMTILKMVLFTFCLA